LPYGKPTEAHLSNVQLVREAYEAFGRGDISTVLGMMDPGIEWREAEGNPYQPSGEAWKGPDAIVQNLFVKIAADFDGTFVIQPKEFHDAGDTVVVEGRYVGTNKETGKQLGFQQFVDTAQLQDVLGT
jgi:hypothetical protein